MFFCIGIKVIVVKDPRAFLPTSEHVSWERGKIPLRTKCVYSSYVLFFFFFILCPCGSSCPSYPGKVAEFQQMKCVEFAKY